MKTSELSEVLSIFSGVCKKNALTEEYRCLLLSPNSIRGAAPFGVVEASIELPITEPVFVDGEKFISLVKTLPDTELELIARKSSLQWKCGSTKGQFALKSAKKPKELELPSAKEFEAPEGFSEALTLAATSCDSPALVAMGLYGIVVEQTDSGLIGYSSNNRTVSSAVLGPETDLGDPLTLSPDAVRLIALASREEGAVISTGEGLVGVQTENLKLLLRQVAPLKQNVRHTIERFAGEEKKVALQRGPISEFLRRVDILAEQRGQSRITLTIEKGQTLLTFQDGAFASDAGYENEGNEDMEEAAKIDAKDFSGIIGKVDSIIFDHVSDGAVVLASGDGKFRYIIDCAS